MKDLPYPFGRVTAYVGFPDEDGRVNLDGDFALNELRTLIAHLEVKPTPAASPADMVVYQGIADRYQRDAQAASVEPVAQLPPLPAKVRAFRSKNTFETSEDFYLAADIDAREALRAQAASVEPVGYVDAHELKALRAGEAEPTISKAPVSEHDVAIYASAPPAHVAADVEAGKQFFSYDSEGGFEKHGTAEKAKAAATEQLAVYREEAGHDYEWPGETESICWGVVLASAVEVPVPDAPDDSVDYLLSQHPTPSPAQAVDTRALLAPTVSHQMGFQVVGNEPPKLDWSDAEPAQAVDAVDSADDLRNLGWSVAVHNDYRLHGEHYTFWLVTKDGQAVKGEGRTDAEALAQIRAALQASRQPQAQQGGGEVVADSTPHMNPQRKPTPAQRDWLSAIATGKVRMFGNTHSLRGYPGNPRKSDYRMTNTLKEAGWVEYTPIPGCLSNKYTVELTEAGHAALATKGQS